MRDSAMHGITGGEDRATSETLSHVVIVVVQDG